MFTMHVIVTKYMHPNRSMSARILGTEKTYALTGEFGTSDYNEAVRLMRLFGMGFNFRTEMIMPKEVVKLDGPKELIITLFRAEKDRMEEQ